MKRLVPISVLLITLLLAQYTKAQQLSEQMQTVYNTCLEIQSAIESGSELGLRSASETLKKSDIKYFRSFKPVDKKDELSLNDHFVFDYEFIDSLVAGHKVYEYAEKYAKCCSSRQASVEKNKVQMITCAVRAESTTVYKVHARDHQEFAFVTEPGGLITVRIHDVTHEKWYSDKKNETEGESSRVLVMELPDESCTLYVEVINITKEDISFVVIAN